MNFEKVINAWREAADDLQIKIQSPFILSIPDKKEIKYKLLIENFGNTLGTLIIAIDEMTEFNTAKQGGYYFTALNPDMYSTYERGHFIDTLNDWGYFGDESKKPNWYAGQPWT